MNKQWLYWILQLVGWGLFTGIFLLLNLLLAAGQDSLGQLLLLQVVVGFALLGGSHLLRLFMKRHRWKELAFGKLVLRVLLACLLMGLLLQGVIHLVIYLGLDWAKIQPFSWGNFFLFTGNVMVLLLMWSVCYFAYQFTQKSREKELETLQVQAQLKEAELRVLKNQVNPHFLFNALNNIRSLILSDPEQARDMLTHISDLLRYSIQFTAQSQVSLAQELDIVQDYLALESIHYGERLRYEIEIPPACMQVQIPPMAIQLLVENAIKHGISNLPKGGTIQIQAAQMEEELVITVTNSGQITSQSSGTGIGLQNLISRLNVLFGSSAELSLNNASEHTVAAMLRLPMLSPST